MTDIEQPAVRASHPEAGGLRSRYPTEIIMEALSIYASTDSIETASRHANVPPYILQAWLRNDGAQSVVQSLRHGIRHHIGHKLVQGIVRASEVVLDRLNHGDTRYDKEGNAYPAQISGRDAAYILSVLGTHYQAIMAEAAATEATAKFTDLAAELIAKTQAKLEELAKHQPKQTASDLAAAALGIEEPSPSPLRGGLPPP